MLPTFDDSHLHPHPHPLPEAVDEPAPDSQFESFYDEASGVWTLRRISSSPPPCDVQDDAA
jgi:hypothetical protein